MLARGTLSGDEVLLDFGARKFGGASPSLKVAASLELQGDTKLELDFDLAPLFNAPSPLSFGRDGTSTHSRDGDAIAAALVANLPGSFRVRRIGVTTPGPLPTAGIKPLFLPEKLTPYRFEMGATFPIPALPRDNPLLEERVALGKRLFHETALSRDGSVSCASCHDARHAFADPRAASVGVRGRTGTRNAMPLFNLAWKNSFFWDGRAPSLRVQAHMQIQDHAEMDENLTNVVAKLSPLSLTPGFSPVSWRVDAGNRFNGFWCAREAVKTARCRSAGNTPG